MFTGIVQTKAEVIFVKTENNLSRISLAIENCYAQNLTLGASIAINGVCLTVVAYRDSEQAGYSIICFDVINETLKVTNLAALKKGSIVNLERSLAVGDELGGHMVSGHVQCQARLAAKQLEQQNCTLLFELDKQWLNYIFAKGFISINGVSLTVGQVSENGFSVYLIPETLARTNLSALMINDLVNIECDQQTITIVSTIERMQLAKLTR